MTSKTVGEIAAVMTKLTPEDWTVDRKSGRSNSSARFLELSAEVGRLIRRDAFSLLQGRSEDTGRLIMAQLAHVHGLAPSKKVKRSS